MITINISNGRSIGLFFNTEGEQTNLALYSGAIGEKLRDTEPILNVFARRHVNDKPNLITARKITLQKALHSLQIAFPEMLAGMTEKQFRTEVWEGFKSKCRITNRKRN